MTNDALKKHISGKHPNGPIAECDWNDSGCEKRIRHLQLLKDHIRYEHEHAPPRRGMWTGLRIEGSALRRCENCGHDFLFLLIIAMNKIDDSVLDATALERSPQEII